MARHEHEDRPTRPRPRRTRAVEPAERPTQAAEDEPPTATRLRPDAPVEPEPEPGRAEPTPRLEPAPPRSASRRGRRCGRAGRPSRSAAEPASHAEQAPSRARADRAARARHPADARQAARSVPGERVPSHRHVDPDVAVRPRPSRESRGTSSIELPSRRLDHGAARPSDAPPGPSGAVAAHDEPAEPPVPARPGVRGTIRREAGAASPSASSGDRGRGDRGAAARRRGEPARQPAVDGTTAAIQRRCTCRSRTKGVAHGADAAVPGRRFAGRAGTP